MAVPPFNQIFYPLLKILENGEIIHMRKASKLVEGFFPDLTEEDLAERLSDGEQKFMNRVSWARTYLKKAGLIDQPERGVVRITSEGIKALRSGVKEIDVNFLRQYQGFIDFENINKKSSREETAQETNSALSPQDMVEAGIGDLNRTLQDDLLQRLQATDPYYFEQVVLKLFQAMGYGEFKGTPKSGDGGIDGVINQDKLGLESIYVQAKRYADNNKVREPDVRNFIGAMSGDVSKGIFVTTSSFDDGATHKAKYDRNHRIVLIDGAALTSLMIRYNIGVQVTQTYELKEIDEDFFQLD